MPGLIRSSLLCHPIDAPRNPGFAIETGVSTIPGGKLSITYRVLGNVRHISVPERLTGGPANGLWRHTCFEAFVARNGVPAYTEFNFSPSGQWAIYHFASYRAPLREAKLTDAPELAVRLEEDVLELNAMLPLAALPDSRPGDRLAIGLSAVIESADGELSHWALAHPGERPDFHDRDGFVIELPVDATTFPEDTA